MKVIYLDTSALVKRYYQEEGTEKVEVLMREAVAFTSKVAYPETLAALAKKWREGEITEVDFRNAVSDFKFDWHFLLAVVELTDEIVDLAGTLVEKYPLKGFDAVHLASALSVRRGWMESFRFVCSDQTLLKAADAEGLEILDPSQQNGEGGR